MIRGNVLKLNRISWNVSQCGDVGMVDKYPKSVPKYSNYVTLPHFGGLERLSTTHVAAMTLKVILCQNFYESVSNFGMEREHLDESLAHMFAKMMITNFYVLCL
jgi:hypothetical protein